MPAQLLNELLLLRDGWGLEGGGGGGSGCECTAQYCFHTSGGPELIHLNATARDAPGRQMPDAHADGSGSGQGKKKQNEEKGVARWCGG